MKKNNLQNSLLKESLKELFEENGLDEQSFLDRIKSTIGIKQKVAGSGKEAFDMAISDINGPKQQFINAVNGFKDPGATTAAFKAFQGLLEPGILMPSKGYTTESAELVKNFFLPMDSGDSNTNLANSIINLALRMSLMGKTDAQSVLNMASGATGQTYDKIKAKAVEFANKSIEAFNKYNLKTLATHDKVQKDFNRWFEEYKKNQNLNSLIPLLQFKTTPEGAVIQKRDIEDGFIYNSFKGFTFKPNESQVIASLFEGLDSSAPLWALMSLEDEAFKTKLTTTTEKFKNLKESKETKKENSMKKINSQRGLLAKLFLNEAEQWSDTAARVRSEMNPYNNMRNAPNGPRPLNQKDIDYYKEQGEKLKSQLEPLFKEAEGIIESSKDAFKKYLNLYKIMYQTEKKSGLEHMLADPQAYKEALITWGKVADIGRIYQDSRKEYEQSKSVGVALTKLSQQLQKYRDNLAFPNEIESIQNAPTSDAAYKILSDNQGKFLVEKEKEEIEKLREQIKKAFGFGTQETPAAAKEAPNADADSSATKIQEGINPKRWQRLANIIKD